MAHLPALTATANYENNRAVPLGGNAVSYASKYSTFCRSCAEDLLRFGLVVRQDAGQ